VALLPPGPQLGEHPRIDRRLRVDEALEVEGIVGGHRFLRVGHRRRQSQNLPPSVIAGLEPAIHAIAVAA
jgi:hypothetical protein